MKTIGGNISHSLFPHLLRIHIRFRVPTADDLVVWRRSIYSDIHGALILFLACLGRRQGACAVVASCAFGGAARLRVQLVVHVEAPVAPLVVDIQAGANETVRV